MPVKAPFANRIEQVESGGQDYPPDSRAGAIGPMQIMPETAADYGYTPEQIRDPATNRALGRRILHENLDRYNGNETLAAIAYNAGRGRADRIASGDMSISELPRETQRYIVKAGTAGEPVSGLNPDPDSSYATSLHQQRVRALQRDFVMQVESAATPAERSTLLFDNDFMEDSYLQLKKMIGFPTTPEEAGAQQQAVEGTSGSEATAPPAYLDPVEIAAGAAGFSKALVEAGIAIPNAVAGTAAANEFLGLAQQRAAEFFPKHPALAQVVGGIVGMGLLTDGVGAVSKLAESAAPPPQVAESPEQVQAAFEGRGQIAGKPEGETAAETPPVREQQAAAPGIPPAQPPVPPSAGAAAPPPAAPQRPPGIEHSDIAIQTAAAARPMTAAEIAAIPLVGEPDHIMPANNLDVVDELRIRNYAGDALERAITNARVAAESGDSQAQAAADAAIAELVTTVKPAYDAANHQAGLQLRHAGDPATRDVLNQVVSSATANADNVAAMRAIAALKTPTERRMLAEQLAVTPKWSWRGALYNYYVNSILSFNSVGKKAVSDVGNLIFQVPVRALAETGSRAYELATGAPTGSIGVPPGEAAASVKALVESWGDIVKYGLDGALTNKPKLESEVGFYDQPTPPQSLMAGSGYEGTLWGRGLNLLGHIVSVPGRGIIGVNEFAAAANFYGNKAVLVNREAYQQAMSEGLSGEALGARVAALTNELNVKTPNWINQEAMQGAKINIFQADLGKTAAAFNVARQSSFITRFLLPFFKTPVNITAAGIRMSPLAPISPTWRNTMAAGGPEAVLQGTKTALGTGLCAYIGYQALKGNITGDNPYRDKPDMAKLWSLDHQPYSINLGKDKDGKTRWQSYQGIEPFSWLMGMCADAAPIFPYLKQGEVDQAVGQMAFAAVNEIKREQMWGSVHSAMQVLDDAGKGKVQKVMTFLGRLGAGFIPSTLANYAGEVDPVRRQTLTFFDEFRNRNPWLKANGLPTLDPLYGKPMIVPPGYLFNEFPAFKQAGLEGDPLVDKMIELYNAVGFMPPEIPSSLGGGQQPEETAMAPPEKLYGVTVTPELKNRWIELRATVRNAEGLTLAEKLRQTAERPDFIAAGEQGKHSYQAALWQADWMGYQAVAEGALLKEHKELIQQVKEAYSVKAKALHVDLGTP